MSPPILDAVVVGAGPAGCRAALTLADLGHRAVVVDRERFPRWKPCAGGITAKALPWVDPALHRLFERTMRGTRLTWGGRHSTHVHGSEALGWTVHRESFDQAHLELVRARPGIEVLEGEAVRAIEEDENHVRVRTRERELIARVVIGADGVNGVVSRFLPGHDTREFAVAYEGEAGFQHTKLTDDVIFDFRRFAGGYGWVFPKTDHYSVGGYVCGRPAARLTDDYDRLCGDLATLDGAKTYRRRGHRIPIGGGERGLHTRRVVLAGDAADLADPLTGEGIYFALRSGQLAAEAVAAFLSEGRPLEAYTETIEGEMRAEIRRARTLARLIWRASRLAGFLLMKNPVVCRWCVEILGGRRTYASLRHELRRGVLTLPLAFRPWRRLDVDLDRPAAARAGHRRSI